MKNRSVRNYIYNATYQVLVAIIPIVTAPYISRTLGVYYNGIYSYYFSIVTYFILITQLGTSTYGTRVVSTSDKDNRNVEFSALVYISFVMGAIATVGFGGLTLLQDVENMKLCVIFFLHIWGAAIDINWLFFGLENFKTTTIRNICIKVLTTLIILLCIKKETDIYLYALIISASQIISSIIVWPKALTLVKLVKVPRNILLRHFKQCFVLFVPSIATSLYKHMDKIILGEFSSMDEVGLYSYAEKIPALLLGFIGAAGVVMMPRISGLIKLGDKENTKKLLDNTMKIVMFLASAISFGLAGISVEFCPMFFGEEYTKSGLYMMIIALSIIFTSWACIIRNLYILPMKKDKLIIFTVSIGALINLVIDLILIPSLSSYGALIGLVAAEISIPINQYILLKKELSFGNCIKNTIPFIIAGLIMFIVVRYLGELMGIGYLTTGVQVVVGVAVYACLTLFAFRKFTKLSIRDLLMLVKR